MTWTIIEPAVYFMCACMPSLRPLICGLFGQTITRLCPSTWHKSNAISAAPPAVAKGVLEIRREDVIEVIS